MNHPTSPSPLEKTASIAAGEQQAGDSALNDESICPNIHDVLAQARPSVTRAVNSAMVNAYWEIGRQINETIGERAEYGKHLLSYLSKRLTDDFGKGFTVASLRNMRQFYQVFPIRYALRSELSWLQRTYATQPACHAPVLPYVSNSAHTARRIELVPLPPAYARGQRATAPVVYGRSCGRRALQTARRSKPNRIDAQLTAPATRSP